jgi:uroporphyrin-III C-methyltransferase / precorrin-2 dehydrogenase / sirohydrochlorin ferrochelatase
MRTEAPVFPIFLKLARRKVLVVGGGAVAASKLDALFRSGATVIVVAPAFRPEILRSQAILLRRGFEPSDLDGVWYAVAAATPEVNARVAEAAEERRIFVNAVDDPASASAYAGGVLRRGDLTIAISTEGQAPAVAGLLREALEELLPEEITTWLDEAQRQKRLWREERVPMISRRPLMLAALNRLYRARGESSAGEAPGKGA